MIVAEGNGSANDLNQLNFPTYIFVNEDSSLYISDTRNNRVMKWRKDAREGIVVARGNGQGKSPTQLNFPQGVIADHLGQIYVAECDNH
jgi:sugar lactone lactonase YvrE